jgi:MFS family permease
MKHSVILTVFLARVFIFTPFITIAGCLPVLIEEWKIGATEASYIVSGFYFTYAFSLMGFSWLSDYVGARKSVTISLFGCAAACAAFAFLARDYSSTLVLYSLIGLCQGGAYTPLIAVFRENAPPERLGTAIGWLISSTSIGYAASIALTGLCIGISGWQLAFMVTGLLPVGGCVIMLIALRPLPNIVHPRRTGLALWQELRRNRNARNLLATYTAHNWELLGMWSWAPALVAASFVLHGASTVSATQWSAHFITVLHIGGAFAAYSMGRLSDRMGRRNVMIWTAAIATAFSFGIGWMVTLAPYVIATLVIVYSFFAIGDSPVMSTSMAERVEPSYLGAMLAIRSLVGFISAAISPIVVGRVIDLMRAGEAGDTVTWGVAFATLGLGGLLAVYFAARLPADR